MIIIIMMMAITMDGWMDAWMHGCMDGWMDAWMHGCMNAWMHAWMDAWMDILKGDCLYIA